jgi:ribose 5-phosphate isomerase B
MKKSPKKSPAKKVFIASDHAGFLLKSLLIEKLAKLGFQMVDLGCDSSEKSVDYPDFAKKLVKKISAKNSDFGILICGSGVGISIAANRSKHIRAALCHNSKVAELSRLHNDANVLVLGSRITKEKTSLAIAKTFLVTKFEGGRHVERVRKLSHLR